MFISLLPFSGRWFSNRGGNRQNHRILRKPSRHTYTTGIMGLLQCLPRHVLVCENVLLHLKSDVSVDMAVRDTGPMTRGVFFFRFTLFWRCVAYLVDTNISCAFTASGLKVETLRQWRNKNTIYNCICIFYCILYCIVFRLLKKAVVRKCEVLAWLPNDGYWKKAYNNRPRVKYTYVIVIGCSYFCIAVYMSQWHIAGNARGFTLKM